MVVASELYRISKLDLTNPNPIHQFPAYLYFVSKYANIVFTLELARRLEGTGKQFCIHRTRMPNFCDFPRVLHGEGRTPCLTLAHIYVVFAKIFSSEWKTRAHSKIFTEKNSIVVSEFPQIRAQPFQKHLSSDVVISYFWVQFSRNYYPTDTYFHFR